MQRKSPGALFFGKFSPLAGYLGILGLLASVSLTAAAAREQSPGTAGRDRNPGTGSEACADKGSGQDHAIRQGHSVITEWPGSSVAAQATEEIVPRRPAAPTLRHPFHDLLMNTPAAAASTVTAVVVSPTCITASTRARSSTLNSNELRTNVWKRAC